MGRNTHNVLLLPFVRVSCAINRLHKRLTPARASLDLFSLLSSVMLFVMLSSGEGKSLVLSSHEEPRKTSSSLNTQECAEATQNLNNEVLVAPSQEEEKEEDGDKKRRREGKIKHVKGSYQTNRNSDSGNLKKKPQTRRTEMMMEKKRSFG